MHQVRYTKSSASESKPFQSLPKGEILSQARQKEQLNRSKLKQAFLCRTFDVLNSMCQVRLMKRSVSEPGLTITFSMVLFKTNRHQLFFFLQIIHRNNIRDIKMMKTSSETTQQFLFRLEHLDHFYGFKDHKQIQ